MSLRCVSCDATWPEALRRTLCDCGGLLIWTPEALGAPVSLGEGDTPLVPLRRWAAHRGFGFAVWAKCEHLNPTGSFKDRGSAMLLGQALRLGARRLVEDSSGNAGASMAAYAARAGIPCTVYAPASAPAAKLRQAVTAGAELRRVGGSREDVARAAMADDADGAIYAGHNINPYFTHGMRSFAQEIAGFDHAVMPVGGGSLLVGAWLDRGEAGPRLHGVQSTGCAPVARAFERGLDDVAPVETAPTVAGGIRIALPPRGALMLRALRETGGRAVAVSDAAILQTRRELATLEGLDVEPTSAAAFAGLAALQIPDGDRAVVAITGAGWKDPG